MKKNKDIFTIKELCLMAILSALGMFAKPLFSPLFNVLTDFIRIPGGSCTAGVSMMFLVFTAELINKKGTATLMGVLQAAIALGTGISSVAGILVFITYTVPGIAIDLVLCTNIFKRFSTKTKMALAGALAVLCGAGATNMLYFHLSLIPFILFYIFGIISGSLGGLIAYTVLQKLPQSIKNMR